MAWLAPLSLLLSLALVVILLYCSPSSHCSIITLWHPASFPATLQAINIAGALPDHSTGSIQPYQEVGVILITIGLYSSMCAVTNYTVLDYVHVQYFYQVSINITRTLSDHSAWSLQPYREIKGERLEDDVGVYNRSLHAYLLRLIHTISAIYLVSINITTALPDHVMINTA